MVLPRGVTWVTVAAIRNKATHSRTIRKAVVVNRKVVRALSRMVAVECRIRARVVPALHRAQRVDFSVDAWAGEVTLRSPATLPATVQWVQPQVPRDPKGNPAPSPPVQRPSGSNRPALRAVLAKAMVRRKKPA